MLEIAAKPRTRGADDITEPQEVVSVAFPVGMLGAGFPPETLESALMLGADVIAVDGGSTDSGPHYLATGTAKTARPAVLRDLSVILDAASRAKIPVIIGSCGTSGTDAGVDWVYEMVKELAASQGLRIRVARLYSELEQSTVQTLREDGKIRALAPALELESETIDRCGHIVGLMGHEPIAAALADGADVVLAGRATDTALTAALPLLRGMPAGAVWHAAKIAECGGLCTTDPRSGGVLVTFDREGFVIEPLAEGSACTPMSVAAHLLYENADPVLLREPAGTLDVSAAEYKALDDRRVRVTGSVWTEADQYTVKLEGAGFVGHQTMLIAGIRDPKVLSELDRWCSQVLGYLHYRIQELLGLDANAYQIELRRYGYDAVLGDAEPGRTTPPREVGIVFIATAPDQATATDIGRLANPVLLHAPLAPDEPLPSFALLGSPAEVERGAVHEFLLQHVVNADSPDQLVRTVFTNLPDPAVTPNADGTL